MRELSRSTNETVPLVLPFAATVCLASDVLTVEGSSAMACPGAWTTATSVRDETARLRATTVLGRLMRAGRGRACEGMQVLHGVGGGVSVADLRTNRR